MATTQENGSKFYVTGIDGLRDPVRNTRWRVNIPSTVLDAIILDPTNDIGLKGGGESSTELFAIHVKDCKLPTIKSKTKELWYMGFAQQHVVQQEGLHGEMEFGTILLEDMAAYEIMMAWHQSTINTGILSDAAQVDRMTGVLSLGLGVQKNSVNPYSNLLRNQTISVELYNWMNGDTIYRLNLINAMPTSVGDITELKYGPDADIMNFKFKLKYDRWTVYIPSDYNSKTV